MNWVGGARARVKAANQNRGPQTRKINERMNETSDDDSDNNEEEPGSRDENNEQVQRNTSTRTRKNKSHGHQTTLAKDVDYESLGYQIHDPDPVHRRVVPLLEFVEKNFPQGHVLSLQLNFQMDITRTPLENNRNAYEDFRCPTSKLSGINFGSVTSSPTTNNRSKNNPDTTRDGLSGSVTREILHTSGTRRVEPPDTVTTTTSKTPSGTANSLIKTTRRTNEGPADLTSTSIRSSPSSRTSGGNDNDDDTNK